MSFDLPFLNISRWTTPNSHSHKEKTAPPIALEKKGKITVHQPLFATLPVYVFEVIAAYLNLPELNALGLSCKKIQKRVQKLSIWDHLAIKSCLVLARQPSFSVFSASVAAGHRGALKTCSQIYFKGEKVKKDFQRGIEFLEQLKAHQKTSADRAEVDLDIALAHARYSTRPDRFKKAIKLNYHVIGNSSLPKCLRARACFAIVRLNLYYEPKADYQMVNQISLVYSFLLSLDISESHPELREEAALLNSITYCRMRIMGGKDCTYLKDLRSLAQSATTPPLLRKEARLHLADLFFSNLHRDISSADAYKIAAEIAEDPDCTPEMRTYARRLLAMELCRA